MMHYYVWDDHSNFLVTAQAGSMKEARKLVLQAIEDSTFYEPVRTACKRYVESTAPFVYHGPQAHIACYVDQHVVNQRKDLEQADLRIAQLLKENKMLKELRNPSISLKEPHDPTR